MNESPRPHTTDASPRNEAAEPLLRAHPLLRDLGGRQLDALRPLARAVRFEPGAFLFHTNDPATTLYLIASGEVALDVHVPGRGATHVETLHGGDVLGLSWMAPPFACTIDALAIEPVEAVALDAARLRALFEREPVLGYVVCTRLIGELLARVERARLAGVLVPGAGRLVATRRNGAP